jgi:hypothetical protein
MEGTEAAEEARVAAAEAADAAAAAAAAKVISVSRCCDEETANAGMPASPVASPRGCNDSVSVGALSSADVAALLAAADCFANADSDADACIASPRAPPSPRAAASALTELCVAHPLLHAGAGVLVFAAQAAAFNAGLAVAAAVSASSFSSSSASFFSSDAADAEARLRYRLWSLALDVLTVGAGAMVLRGEMQRCAAPPRLRTSVCVAAVIGFGTLFYAMLLTAGVPGVDGADLAVTTCTAAASLLVRALTCLCACIVCRFFVR